MHEWKIVLAGNKDLQIKANRRFGTLLKIHWTIAIKIYKWHTQNMYANYQKNSSHYQQHWVGSSKHTCLAVNKSKSDCKWPLKACKCTSVNLCVNHKINVLNPWI